MEWIRSADRMPEILDDGGSDTVLVCFQNKTVTVAYYIKSSGNWYKAGQKLWNTVITHWMPLPKPPKNNDDTTA